MAQDNGRDPGEVAHVLSRDVTLYHADCRAVLPTLAEGSVDACVCDPPYELGFMGKGWDRTGIAYDMAMWRMVYRALRPGAHLLAFGGARTYHRLACAVEDAGFDIRDQIMYIYGNGFPKSHNLVGPHSGWGSALKPAYEPIVVARKPLEGTIAENVLRHGTGALNIDGCRIPILESLPHYTPSKSGLGRKGIYGKSSREQGANSPKRYDNEGRWPANLITDGSPEVLEMFPWTDGQGSAARFFYCAKASREDRDEGLENFPDVLGGMRSENSGQHITRRDGGDPGAVKNSHPSVKPTDLMRYLCRLVTPPGGVVLDPFLGSGSTGKAAVQEGFRFVGMESDREHGYFPIACARVAWALRRCGEEVARVEAMPAPSRPVQGTLHALFGPD